MHIGIDFGTSYSAAAAIIDGKLTLVRFGDAEQFRTAVFFPERVPDPSDFSLTPALEAQLEAQLRLARTQQRQLAAAAAAHGQTPASRSEGELRREALRVVRRQWLEEQTRAVGASVASFQHALFGEEAVEGYLESGGGNLIESPKSMFGYRLDPQVRKVIVHIATHILEHIRLTASRQFGVPVRGAVIGRPVEFRSSMGAQGSAQAIEILREAAAAAGFDSVTFLEEPAAAAMHYHQSLQQRQHALIVDIAENQRRRRNVPGVRYRGLIDIRFGKSLHVRRTTISETIADTVVGKGVLVDLIVDGSTRDGRFPDVVMPDHPRRHVSAVRPAGDGDA